MIKKLELSCAVPELVGDGYSAAANDLKTSAGDFPTSNPMPVESRFQARLKHQRDVLFSTLRKLRIGGTH